MCDDRNRRHCSSHVKTTTQQQQLLLETGIVGIEVDVVQLLDSLEQANTNQTLEKVHTA